jgi:putative membrane protein
MLYKLIWLLLFRWAASTLAMWVCITLFADMEVEPSFWLFVIAGLVFSLVNSIVKPFATLLALPFIILTMGLFVLILNAAMVGLTIWVLPDIKISFGGAVLAAITISIINYLVNLLIPSYNKKRNKE